MKSHHSEWNSNGKQYCIHNRGDTRSCEFPVEPDDEFGMKNKIRAQNPSDKAWVLKNHGRNRHRFHGNILRPSMLGMLGHPLGTEERNTVCVSQDCDATASARLTKSIRNCPSLATSSADDLNCSS